MSMESMDEIKTSITTIRDQVREVNTTLKGKSSNEIILDRTYTRDILIDMIFSLKTSCTDILEISGKLIDSQESSAPVNAEMSQISTNDITDIVRNMLPEIIANTVKYKQCLIKKAGTCSKC